jgi:F1F0 ATPase subunit 2
MAMNDMPGLVLAVVAGAALGVVFFAGLSWTVRKALKSERPALWVIGSQLVRVSVALSGFYFVSGGRWERLLACLAGFVVARQSVIRLTRPPQEDRTRATSGASRAP